MSPQSLAKTSLAVGLVLSTRLALAGGPPSKSECIAANESAQDLRHAGKLRAARTKLALCVAESCPGPVRADCAQVLSEVLAGLPTLVFEVRDASGNDLSDVRVTAESEVLADKLGGTALTVNPGAHHFVFEAEGFPKTEKNIVVHVGDKERHIQVTMGPPAAAAPGDRAPTADAPGGNEHAPATDAASVGATQRTAGLVLGGVGVAGLVVGSIFGVLTKVTYDSALQNECHGSATGCSAQGASDGKSAHTQGAIATGGFVGGGVLLAGGALLYFTAPKQGLTVGPAVGAGSLGLRIWGTW